MSSIAIVRAESFIGLCDLFCKKVETSTWEATFESVIQMLPHASLPFYDSWTGHALPTITAESFKFTCYEKWRLDHSSSAFLYLRTLSASHLTHVISSGQEGRFLLWLPLVTLPLPCWVRCWWTCGWRAASTQLLVRHVTLWLSERHEMSLPCICSAELSPLTSYRSPRLRYFVLLGL